MSGLARFSLLIGVAVLSVCQYPARAHHSPIEIIEQITERIEKGERSAAIYARRGDEYRAVGDEKAAIADYQVALELERSDLGALYGLTRASLALGQYENALNAVARALVVASDADEAAPFYAVAARSYAEQQQWSAALNSWRASLASSRPEADWFLGEAHSLRKLDRIDEAIEALEKAQQRNPSVVLEREWLKLLIDSGHTEKAAPRISAGLERVRWKSSWLLLRARMRLMEGNSVSAEEDAQAALKEIDGRLNLKVVNPFLLADRATALAMLGRDEQAEICAKRAREFGLTVEVDGLRRE